ncbi:protein GLUTAMINE DUMPER 6-like [Phragmites australis]|uniref:protein GLUTAMINE DUMPER 6-like n=1 Tax=Phragmites australis TaxID=29695 RepID=UPI002D771625|nr:protein GLUTAMINE DUMPER 6-like [Phragmites australis]
MRPARIDMAMEDGGGASSSVQEPLYGYGHVQPPPFWSTPTPYLFIGFAVVMALIAVALAVLLCSRRREEEGEGEAGVMSVRVLAPLDREDVAMPKVVVVMAGDHEPSFIASAAPLAFAAAAKAAQMPQHVGGDKDGAAV